MDGEPEDSHVYCSKEDKNKFVYGELPKPGKRNDLHMVAERILEGTHMVDIVRNDVSAAAVYIRYNQGLHRLRNLLSKKRTCPPKVYWIYGPTGVHKTRVAHEFGEAMGLSDCRDHIWSSNGDLKWFDGYDGQELAILDDLRAKQVQFAFLLRLLDRYDLDVPIKGGFAHWIPGVIIITTPHTPELTFETRHTHKPEDIDQLKRRITYQFDIKTILDDQQRLSTIDQMLVAGGFPPREAPQGSPPRDAPQGSDVEVEEMASILSTMSQPPLVQQAAQLFPDDVECWSEPENEDELSLESYNDKVLRSSQGDINSDLSCSDETETHPFTNTQELFSGVSSSSSSN